jgi:hypothetical protein
MVTLTQRGQVVPAQKLLWEWIDRLRSLEVAWGRGCFRVRFRNRLFCFIAVGFAAALAALAFSGAVTGQKMKAPASSIDDAADWPLSQAHSAVADGALYVHSKLMQVGISRSGAPVLRFVECRHYPKEHSKLVQTSMTAAGSAVLRFMPGDYCLFGPAPPANGALLRLGSQSLLAAKDESQSPESPNAQSDELKDLLTPYQRYACEKFGPACRVALAIQFAENPQGACEIYHYNSNGTLDWGFFQINTVHLTRPGLNLRDLLDCKANIDFAYQLFREQGFAPWMTYVSGAYRRFLFHHEVQLSHLMSAQRGSTPGSLFHFGGLQQPSGQSGNALPE